MSKGGGGSGGSDYGSMMGAIASMQAAQLQYQLGNNQLNWAKDVYNQNYPYIQQGAQQSLDAQKQANEFATSQENFYNQNYQPLEKQFIDQAKNWDTPQSEQLVAGQAQEQVASQFAQARSAASQQLESFGVDPTSTRYAALDVGTRTQQAAAEAGQGTAAIQNRQQQGMALESGAINTGRGYANSIPATMGTAGNLGASAAGSLTGFYGTGAQATNGANAWFQSGNQAMGNGINGFNNYYQNTYPVQQGGSSGIGAGLGLIGGLMQKFEDGGTVLGGDPAGRPDTALPSQRSALPVTHVVPAEASPSAGKNVDDVQARLNVGEFVIPKEVVQWEGEKHFYAMIDKAKAAKERALAETTAKPSALPALPGPATFHSPGAHQQRAALPA